MADQKLRVKSKAGTNLRSRTLSRERFHPTNITAVPRGQKSSDSDGCPNDLGTRSMTPLASQGFNPLGSDVEVPVLTFAQWVTELKGREKFTHHQLYAELSSIKQSNVANTQSISEFKRQTATVQHNMQNDISDLHDGITRLLMEIASARRSAADLEQNVQAQRAAVREKAALGQLLSRGLQESYDVWQAQVKNDIAELHKHQEIMGKELQSFRDVSSKFEFDRVDNAAAALQEAEDEWSAIVSTNEESKENLRGELRKVSAALDTLSRDVRHYRTVSTSQYDQLRVDTSTLEGGMSRRASLSTPGTPHAAVRVGGEMWKGPMRMVTGPVCQSNSYGARVFIK